MPWHFHPRMALLKRERVWILRSSRCYSVLRFMRRLWRVKMAPLVTLLTLLQDGQGSDCIVGLRDEGSHVAGQRLALVL